MSAKPTRPTAGTAVARRPPRSQPRKRPLPSLAPKANCERRRPELLAVVANGRAEAASRLRAIACAGASITALIAASRAGALPHEQQITTR